MDAALRAGVPDEETPLSDSGQPLADWGLAARVGWAVAGTRPSPPVTSSEVALLRQDVTRLAQAADPLAREVTHLGEGLGPPTVRVVGRRAWIRDNLATIAYLTDPVADRLLRRSGVSRTVARRALALQLGAAIGYLSTRVLGQYEAFLPGDVTPGRLTLVGPNLLEAERTLLGEAGLSAEEFRFGVLLHELAHRLQFEAVSWLRPHLRALLDDYLDEARIDPDRVREVLGRLGEVARDPALLRDPQQLMRLVLTPAQQDLIERAQALMALLEGHGNVVMDWGAEAARSGRGVDFDPARVRLALNRRRARTTDRVLRSLLGMSLKAEQYRVGEQFILSVAERHGRDAFHRVWRDSGQVPTREELDDPDAWVARTSA